MRTRLLLFTSIATFALDEDKAVAVYEYCNLHGLWKVDL
nr:desulfoferrodoxin family protein [uncultured Sphaerochaeta sp.]